MHCQKAIDLLVDFLERTLPESTRQALKQHLSACQRCEDFIESYQKTTSLCKNALLEKVPTELNDRLVSFLRQKTQAKKVHN